MIIPRYLIKEVASTLAAVTVVLLLIFLCNQLVRYVGYAASGKIAANILFQLMEFEIPYLLALLLPLGLYLGIIIAYGRLYADNEMSVMQAGGFSLGRLVAVTSGFAIFVMAIVLVLMLWVNPMIAAKKEQLITQGAAENILNAVMPGRFQVTNEGKRVVYVERIARNHSKAQNIFIAEQKMDTPEEGGTHWTVLSAAGGYQVKDRQTQDRFMVAQNGYRYEGTPGQNEYKIIQFEKYAVRVPQEIEMGTRHPVQELIPTNTLWRDYALHENAAELQWRFSVSLSVLLLALLAVPLSQVRPRQSRYIRLLPAILIYVTYVNLLFFARNWMEQGILPASIGMWWVNAGILALALVLMAYRSGWLVLKWR